MPDFFDRLIDEIVRSAPASGGDAPLQSATARRTWSMLVRPRHRRLLVVTALLCVSGALGGLALAGTFSGQTMSPQQWVDGQRVEPEAAMPAAQTANLAILRRGRVATDALLPWDAYSVTHTPMAANGVNPSLSRRATGFTNGAAWVIPGNGTICLITANEAGVTMALKQMAPGATTPTPVAHVPGASGVTACTSDAAAAVGWSAGTSGTIELPGIIFTAGIVPDGVSRVTASLTGGGSVWLPVHENVYMAEVHGWPASISFTGPAGPVTISNGPDVLARADRANASRRARKKP